MIISIWQTTPSVQGERNCYSRSNQQNVMSWRHPVKQQLFPLTLLFRYESYLTVRMQFPAEQYWVNPWTLQNESFQSIWFMDFQLFLRLGFKAYKLFLFNA